jgi:hypothetical protein
MQDIVIHLRADDVAAVIVDRHNQKAAAPTITRGLRPRLCLRLLHGNGSPFAIAELDYAAWDFVLANDWDTGTVPQIRVQEGISVAEVEDEGVTYAEIRIPLTDTNTDELIAALGTSASKTLGAELVGIPAGESDPGAIWQFDMAVRNRRGVAGTGSPVPVGDGTYSSSQVDALISVFGQVTHRVAVDFTASAMVAVFTVPTGKLFRPREGQLFNVTVEDPGDPAGYRWMADAAELVSGEHPASAGAVTVDDLSGTYHPAGTVFSLEVVVPGTSTAHSGKAILIGDLIDV